MPSLQNASVGRYAACQVAGFVFHTDGLIRLQDVSFAP